MASDTERLDFLSRQNITNWVGYSYGNGRCYWPVFRGRDLRDEIDRAMQAKQRRLDESEDDDG